MKVPSMSTGSRQKLLVPRDSGTFRYLHFAQVSLTSHSCSPRRRLRFSAALLVTVHTPHQLLG